MARNTKDSQNNASCLPIDIQFNLIKFDTFYVKFSNYQIYQCSMKGYYCMILQYVSSDNFDVFDVSLKVINNQFK